MIVVGQDVLERFKKKHADVRSWIDAWVKAVNSAAWRSIDDARKTYPHADGVRVKSGSIVTVFNCKGNEYRLLTRIAYAVQTVQVLELMTHAEYSKGSWKGRY